MGLRPRRPAERIPKALELVKRVWEKDVDLRLGQLLVNAARCCDKELFFVEDEELSKGLLEFDKILSKRMEGDNGGGSE